MRKPVYAICEQKRRRFAQSDQRLCWSLPREYNTFSFYIRDFKPLTSFCDCADRFESALVANPEDRFSRDEAHMVLWWFYGETWKIISKLSSNAFLIYISVASRHGSVMI